ncbi:MAG: ribosome maturation factor RimM [Deltaproteobacteria bacterium]
MGLIKYGKITRAHGISGEVKLTPFSRELHSLSSLKTIFIETGPGLSPVETRVLQCRPHKSSAIVRLEGVDSVDDADKLTGKNVYIDNSQLPPLKEDEFYWFQLIGLDIYTDDGRYLGEVQELIDRAYQSVLVVKDGDKELLIPLTEPFVKEINLKESKIITSNLKGLIIQE